MWAKAKNQYSPNNIILRIIEHMSHIKLFAKYSAQSYTYSNIIITKLIFNQPCSALSKYKDYLLFETEKEYIHRFYSINELKIRLKKVCNFYEKYSKIFPNYISLRESKYIYKNIRRKQKMIDAVNQMQIEKNNKEIEKDNKFFDNEIFRGPLFTEDVNKEIDKKIINKENNIEENADDTLFTLNSNSLCLKNENHSVEKKSNIIGKNKEKEINQNKSLESFITNNESNRSLYNIMDILNGNKIYMNDLRLILKEENINLNDINKINYKEKYDYIANKYKKYEDVRQILIKSNYCCTDTKTVNSYQNTQSNNEKIKIKNIQIEENSNIKTVNKKINKKFNPKQFPILSEISEKVKKNKKNAKNKNIFYNNQKNDKNENNNKNINQNSINNNYKKYISSQNKNIKTTKDRLFMNFNITDNNHLSTMPGKESISNYLSNRVSQNHRQHEQKFEKITTKTKTISKKENTSLQLKKNTSPNQLNTIKKYLRQKHISQDLCTYCGYDEKYNFHKTLKLNSCNSLTNNLDKNNSKFKKEDISIKSSINTNSVISSNKNINNIKKMKKPHIINNNIIIQNNNNYNYFFTENNNPNLITGTKKNNGDGDDNDSEREKILEYLRDFVESQKSERLHKSLNNNKKVNKNIYVLNSLITTNTEVNESYKINASNSQKFKKGKFVRDIILKQKTEKKLKQNYKYYFNNINNNNNSSCNQIIKNNSIRKMTFYRRNNSNISQKLVNSIGSFSKIRKYNSNCSIKIDDYISPKKSIVNTNTVNSINCYSHNEYKNQTINIRNEKELLKTKTTKNFTNKFLQVSDIINTESSKNMFNQRIKRNKHKDYLISLTKEESQKKRSANQNELLIIEHNTRNLALNCYNTDTKELNNNNNGKNNHKIEIENDMNKRQNTDMKFKNYWAKNKFSSCDFDEGKKEQVNFNKGLLDRINNIKNKINEGMYKNNHNNNLLKKENTHKACLKNIKNNSNHFSDKKRYNYNELNEKKNKIKQKKIYENKIVYNDNKENISPQFLIKVNKMKHFGNLKSQLYINTDIGFGNIILRDLKK